MRGILERILNQHQSSATEDIADVHWLLCGGKDRRREAGGERKSEQVQARGYVRPR